MTDKLIKFPRNKYYKDYGKINVLPCCTQSQCAFAAADLLKKAVE